MSLSKAVFRSRAMRIAVVCAAATLAGACTSYRILRYRDPDARNQHMFPTRAVLHSDTPLPFATAAVLRNDLDTVTVRAPGAARVSFAKYMTDQKVLAFLVVRNDTIVYERYNDGYSPQTLHSSFSMAKSVLSALLGIAIEEGAIKSLDQPVTDYVRDLAGKPAFAGVTLRNLFEMKSGLRYTPTGNGFVSDFRSDKARAYYTNDTYGFIRNAHRDTTPGSTWLYKDTDAETLGWVLASATGKSIAQLTEEKLWRRIGAEHDASWSLDAAGGHEKVSSGFNATARDLAKFGRVYLNGGMVGNASVVPPAWVAKSASVDSSRTEPENSNWWKMQHSWYWWHPIQSPHGDYYADGAKGQRIYVDPATRTIIVQFANQTSQDFPFRKIAAYLAGHDWEYPRSIPGTLRNIALTGNLDSMRTTYEQLTRDEHAHPEQFVITEHAMNSVTDELIAKPATLAAGIELNRIMLARYPQTRASLVRLRDAYKRSGDLARADSVDAVIKKAVSLPPH